MSVAQEKRAVPHHEVDVLVPVHIPLSAALRPLDEDRKRGEVTDVVRYAGRECAERFFVQTL
jgi:hypothetical protein